LRCKRFDSFFPKERKTVTALLLFFHPAFFNIKPSKQNCTEGGKTMADVMEKALPEESAEKKPTLKAKWKGMGKKTRRRIRNGVILLAAAGLALPDGNSSAVRKRRWKW
jgi:hypothetical protein